MLHHVNKLCSILLLIVITASCRWELSSEQLRQWREKAYQVSINNIGYDEYWSIYNAMNDSVETWAENELEFFKYFNRDSIDYGINYRIDSLLCFNEQNNMCFTGILRQSTDEDGNSDDIWEFYGIKINNKWHFTSGASMTLFRNFYQKEDQPPLSFEKLKELAMEHLYWGYVRKSKGGEWQINNVFFDFFYPCDIYGRRVMSESARDSRWLKASREIWNKRNKR